MATIPEVAGLLRELDQLDGRGGEGDYETVAAGLLEVAEGADPVREISLYLQRLDYLADRLADHPKYFEYLAREILGITPNPHPDEFD